MKLQKKIVISLAMSLAGATLQAQVVIDPLNGTGGISYTTYLANDTSHGAGNGILFSQSGSGLQESYAGNTSTAEQALFLASASSFNTVFAPGDTLFVYSSVLNSSTTLDFGLAISANNPSAGVPTSYDSRSAFDWLSISVRPTANPASVRVNFANNGSVNTGSYFKNPAVSSISGLYITWVSGTTFNVGYIDTSETLNQVASLTFARAGTTIGSDIGFYGDLRAAGTSIGNFRDLSIATVPEPSTVALCGMGLVGIAGLFRRKSMQLLRNI